jgi:cysteinyl-tRNA synthetase
MSLLEVPRSDVDRWVNVCFGAGRDGVEWEPASCGERILLSDALKHFGHPAVALYLLGTHYSLPLGDASTGLVTGSKNALRIREVVRTLAPDQPSPPDMRHYMEAFRDALANDLDTPLAFVVLFEWVLEAERRGGEVGDNDLRVMLEVLELDDLAAPVGA